MHVLERIAAACVVAGLPTLAAAEPIAYGPMEAAGRVSDERIDESSGLAASRLHPGMLWTHNDSGDGPRLYLIDETGATRGSWVMPEATAFDWEDMCSFELDGKVYLLIGDVGDNRRRRNSVTLYLVEEPGEIKKDGVLPVVRRVEVTYADGPHDVESMGFDPERREVVLISKEWPDEETLTVGRAGVYVLPFDAPSAEAASAASPHVLDRVAELALTIPTGMDISPDGRRAVVTTFGDAFGYERGEGETWAEAFARPGVPIALGPRGQNEAVAYGMDGVTLWFTSEKAGQALWRVEPLRAGGARR